MSDSPQSGVLSDIAETNPDQVAPGERTGTLRYIDLAAVNFEDGIRKDGVKELDWDSAPSRARRRVREGDILIATVRPYLRGFARVPGDLDGAVASTGFCVVRPKPQRATSGFLWAVALSSAFVDHLISRQTGSNYPAIRAQDVDEFALRIPSLSHQERIGDLISRFDKVIGAGRRTLAASRGMKRAILSEAFSESADASVALGEIATEVKDKWSPDRDAKTQASVYVGLEHIVPDDRYVSNAGSSDEVESTKTVFKKGDILFGKLRPYLRKVAQATTDGICSTDIVVLRPASSSSVSSDFLYCVLAADRTFDFAQRHSAGTKMPRVSAKELKRLPIFLPASDQRDRLSRTVMAVDREILRLGSLIGALEQAREAAVRSMLGGEHDLPESYDRLLPRAKVSA